MSKTKAQIIEAMGLDDPDGEIEDVMDTWADQRLKEHNAKMKAQVQEIKDLIFEDNGETVFPMDLDFGTVRTKIEQLIDSL